MESIDVTHEEEALREMRGSPAIRAITRPKTDMRTVGPPPTFDMIIGLDLPTRRTTMERVPKPRNSNRASNEGTSEVTRLLRAFRNGDRDAFDRLFPHVYDTLRRVARRQLRGERKDHTLTPTALVHEAYLELARIGDLQFNDRGHFYSAAAQTMRHILIDYAVRRRALKRGGDRKEVPFEHVVLASEDHVEDLITLDQAMQRLEELDGRLVRVIECRFFAGLTIAETADALDISDATVSRDWQRARAWLNREILRDASRESSDAPSSDDAPGSP